MIFLFDIEQFNYLISRLLSLKWTGMSPPYSQNTRPWIITQPTLSNSSSGSNRFQTQFQARMPSSGLSWVIKAPTLNTFVVCQIIMLTTFKIKCLLEKQFTPRLNGIKRTTLWFQMVIIELLAKAKINHMLMQWWLYKRRLKAWKMKTRFYERILLK